MNEDYKEETKMKKKNVLQRNGNKKRTEVYKKKN